MMTYESIPAVCKNCEHLDSDYNEWSGTNGYWCYLNIRFPTKKQTCAKQKKVQP